MPINPEDLAKIKGALEKANDLYVVYQLQSGALRKAQNTSSEEVAAAHGVLKAETGTADNALSRVMIRAQQVYDRAIGDARVAYNKVVDSAQRVYAEAEAGQKAVVEAAEAEAKTAENELLRHQQDMKDAWGLEVNLIIPPARSTFGRGR